MEPKPSVGRNNRKTSVLNKELNEKESELQFLRDQNEVMEMKLKFAEEKINEYNDRILKQETSKKESLQRKVKEL